jgi:sortase A
MSTKNKKKNLAYHFGNALIVGAVLLLSFIYYPLISAYFSPTKVEALEQKEGFFITIPKISAQAPVLENVDPWNQAIYQKALEQGVAHAKGTKLPGENGTIFIFAHSSDSPWRLTRFNTIFLRLGELNAGDEILINKDKKTHKYIVKDKKVVNPNEVEYLKENTKDQLILQTCTPIGTAFQRLLIFAERT